MPAELKRADKTVIVRETDSMKRPKPDSDNPTMENEEEQSGPQSGPFQREDGDNYSIHVPLWKGKDNMDQNTFNADEEVRRLANYAEKNRSKRLMMSQMPEEADWKEAMRALTKVKNVHLRAGMWQYLEPEELPVPRPKVKVTVNKKKHAKAAKKGSTRKEKRQRKRQ